MLLKLRKNPAQELESAPMVFLNILVSGKVINDFRELP